MSNCQSNETALRSYRGTPVSQPRLPLAPRKLISRLPAPVGISRTQSLRLPVSNRPNNFRYVEDPDVRLEAEPQPSESDPSTISAPSKLTRGATFRFPPSSGAGTQADAGENQGTSSDPQPIQQVQVTRKTSHPSVAISRETAEEYIEILEERIRSKIKDFPSVLLQQTKGNQFAPSWNWIQQLRRMFIRNPNPDDCIVHVKSLYTTVSTAHQILEKIRLNFQYGILQDEGSNSDDPSFILNYFVISKPGGRGRMILDDSSFKYVGEMFQRQLLLQDRYAKWQSKILEAPRDSKKRNEVVEWAVKTAVTLKYPAQTTYITVHLIDAFLSIRGNRMTDNSWLLLGITALHIAGKLEEPDRASVSHLISLSGQVFRPEDVCWLEKRILKDLEFDVNPPLAPTFARLVLLGGCLPIRNPTIIKLVMDLSQGILYKSLLNYRLSSILPSEKGQAALEIAVEFVFSQYKAFAKMTLASYDVVNAEPGKMIGDFAVNLCLDTFNQRFMKSKLPKVEQSGQFMSSSPLRGVRV